MEADNVVVCWIVRIAVLKTQTGGLWTAVVAINELSVLPVLMVSVLASITVDVRLCFCFLLCEFSYVSVVL